MLGNFFLGTKLTNLLKIRHFSFFVCKNWSKNNWMNNWGFVSDSVSEWVNVVSDSRQEVSDTLSGWVIL